MAPTAPRSTPPPAERSGSVIYAPAPTDPKPLGPGFVVGVGNGLILGYLMYQSRLVPRGTTMLGLIGGPLICLSGIAVVMDIIGRGSAAQSIATIPEFLWELSLGIYLTVKGFKASPILDETRHAGAGKGRLNPGVAAQ